MKRQITRVVIDNYRSIRHCDVRLGPLTLLVGPNGSGKSNFLDALRFLKHTLHAPLSHLVSSFAGMRTIAHRDWAKAPTPGFSIRVNFQLNTELTGKYELELQNDAFTRLNVSERCSLSSGHEFKRRNDDVESSVPAPAFTADRSALVAFGGNPEFAQVYRLIAGFAFYDPDLGTLRDVRPPERSGELRAGAQNLADVVAGLQQLAGGLDRITDYLAAMLPGFVEVKSQDHGESLRQLLFSFRGSNLSENRTFNSWQVSDGTLRSLALLTALFQPAVQFGNVSLVGLEEPENNLHPAAAGVLLDAMLEASVDVQVVTTTHSADLLDHPELPLDALLTVQLEKGESVIAPVGGEAREIIRRKLYTPGELLRNRQLSPEPTNMHE